VTKEEHPYLEGLRVNLGNVGKTAVMETGALLEMMKAAMENMHALVDERERLQQAKVRRNLGSWVWGLGFSARGCSKLR